MTKTTRVEAPTWAALTLCYAAYVVLTAYADVSVLAYLALAVVIAFFLSLQHEIIHGHPTRWQWLNEALVFIPLGLAFPYERYRDTHLAHHHDNRLTDPYDDPESWYVAPGDWQASPGWFRILLTINNSALGRMIIGPGMSFIRFSIADIRLMAQGKRQVIRAWLLHAVGAALLLAGLSFTQVSPLGYVLSCYAALSLINLRSFLEHRAEERVAGRSAIVEDAGPFALLYLNNNLHAVHHAHPDIPWYEIPAKYRAHKDRYLAMNGGYFFPSYWAVLARHGLRAKEPVAHPLMQSGAWAQAAERITAEKATLQANGPAHERST
ncbi:MAG: fatty acid desaturase [Pikeienuella sp.]